MPFTIMTQGSFTSTGANKKILLPASADYFITKNLTQFAATQTTPVGVQFEWFNTVTPQGGALEWSKQVDTGSTPAQIINTSVITSGGFTYVTAAPYTEAQAANAITGITAANPAVVTQTNTYSNGDYVRIYNTTGDLTIGGMVFQISSVSGSGYTLLGLANVAGNGLAAATAGNTRRLSNYASVDPQYLYVTNISKATSAVVSVSIDPSPFYVVGQKVYFSVPEAFGMTQMNALTGTITAINAASASGSIGAYNFTVNIDSSAFTTFAFPASALSPTAQLFATVSPAGASTQYDPTTGTYTGYNFSIQPFHTGQPTPYMLLAPGVNGPAGQANDVIVWQAFKSETGVSNMGNQ